MTDSHRDNTDNAFQQAMNFGSLLGGADPVNMAQRMLNSLQRETLRQIRDMMQQRLNALDEEEVSTHRESEDLGGFTRVYDEGEQNDSLNSNKPASKPAARECIPAHINDPWVILGVSIDCTYEEATRLYHKKARAYHPDRGGNQRDMSRLNEAYDYLCRLRGWK